MAGFTMLEILIAIVILSIGLLGLAGLHAAGLKNTQNANYRTVAMFQAYDMADRMRSNAEGLYNGAYDNITTSIPSDPGCISTGCTYSQLGDYDQRVWNQNNAAWLPSGRGTVKVSGTNPNEEYVITVMWDEYRTGATGIGCSGDSSTDLTCFSVRIRP